MNSKEPLEKPENYYAQRGLEAIDIIEAYGLDFSLGNAVKYILRAGRKTEDTTADLMKAENYIHRAITGKWLENEYESEY
jgi:hypothetical protein